MNRITKNWSLLKTENRKLKTVFILFILLLMALPAVASAWVTSTIDSTGDVGRSTAIAVDSDNKTHISYLDNTNNSLKYATNASGSWITYVIDNTVTVGCGDVGCGTSIAIDSNNKVHISYYGGSNYDLKYATNASGSWTTSTIEAGGAGWPSIAIDSNNKVHISYRRTSGSRYIKYATNASGSWVISTIASGGDGGGATSIAVDPNNKVHISYYRPSGYDLSYATNVSGSWVTSIIDSEAYTGQYASIAIDSNNKVHISYTRQDPYTPAYGLKYATNVSGSWVKSNIESGDVGWSSIAIDSLNNAYISYGVYNNGSLKYATNVSGSWAISTIDSAGINEWSRQYTSIKLDFANKMHISYYDGTNGYLKYATNASYSINLPRTGQTTSYAAGDDGAIQAGVAWPNPRFTDNSDQTITDNLTGLMWTKDAGTPTAGSCTGGGTKTWQESLDYVACLNSNNYLGHSDWRLPNILEIESLVDSSKSNPALPTGHPFTNVPPDPFHEYYYWSATTNAFDTNSAWLVLIRYNGYVHSDLKTAGYYVWPVRGTSSGPANVWKTGQTTSYATGDDGDLEKGAAWPSPRFTDNGNGTVSDGLTGLIWLKNANCFGTKIWNDALTAANTLANGQCGLSDGSGAGDWRLPNKKELISLIDRSKYGPALPAGYPFTNVPPLQYPEYPEELIYWSSTSGPALENLVWIVDMNLGYMNFTPKDWLDYYYVWPVRGGIVSDTTAPTGSISINSGATYTNSTSVNLTLTCTDASGCSQMQFSNDNSTYSTAETYSTSKSWTLTSGDGTKTVYAKFKDTAGNWSSAYSDTIILDVTTIGYWKFDEMSGSVAADSSANGNNGTITGATWTSGYSGGALQFNGTSGKVEVPHNSTQNASSAVTIEAIVKPNGTQQPLFIPIVSKGTPGTSEGYHVMVNTDNSLTAYIGSNPTRSITSLSSLTTGQWHHIAVQYDGTKNRIYIDKVLDNETDNSGLITATTYKLELGGGDAGEDRGTFNGDIDEIRISNVALAPGQFLPFTPADTTPPTGSITINSGVASTNSTSVTLALSCSDASGCSEMQFSNDNVTYSTAETYATSKSWTLTSGDGTKTVYVKFKDNVGNWSSAYNDTITLDITAPTTTALPAGGTYGSAQSVTLTCNDGTGSGCANIYYTTDGSTPTTSSSVYSGAINISATTTLKFFAKDNAGDQESVKTETYTIGTSIPSAPTGITLSNMKTAGPLVSWSTVSDATSYKVYRSTDNSNWTLIGTVAHPTNSFRDTTAPKHNTPYYWTVTAYNGNGESAKPLGVLGRTALISGWNHVSAPYNTGGNTPTSVYGSWASYTWGWTSTGNTDPDNNGSWFQNPGITPGLAQFTWAWNDSTVLSASGANNSTPLNVTLIHGWNMISNPTTSNITNMGTNWLVDGSSLSSAISSNKIGGDIYWWNGSTYDSMNIALDNPAVEPWKGYWILNLENVNHTLTIQ